MGRRIGYARVSTDDQDLTIQKAALDRDDCAIVFEEKRSGTKRDGRAQLDLALKVLVKGDTLVVTRLDRLGRSLRDLANIAHEIEEAGAHLRVIEQSVDTSTSAGRAFFGMLAVFAQFEREIMRERVRAGLDHARQQGKRLGRPPTAVHRAADAKRLFRQGNSKSEIARRLGIGRTSVRRFLAAYSSQQ